MAQALARDGPAGRNRAQLELLEGEALAEAGAGLAYLRTLPMVDPRRIVLVGHSFGGSLSILLAAGDTTIPAVVLFGAAAASWGPSPALRARLLAAVRRARARFFIIHAANDYSLAPGEALAAELRRIGRPYRLKIYPPVGSTTRAGHNFVFLSVAAWQDDVLAFLRGPSRAP
jgi:dienelactone hydrolase